MDQQEPSQAPEIVRDVDEYRHRRESRLCGWCKKPFQARLSDVYRKQHYGRYCSRACAGRHGAWVRADNRLVEWQNKEAQREADEEAEMKEARERARLLKELSLVEKRQCERRFEIE